MPKVIKPRKVKEKLASAATSSSSPIASTPTAIKRETAALARLARTEEHLLAERHHIPKDLQSIIGVDEAGRGAWFGPLVVAACRLPDVTLLSAAERAWFGQVRDSKKIGVREREQLYEKLCAHPGVISSVEFVSRAKIDRLNVLQATLGGMARTSCAVVAKLRAEETIVTALPDHSTLLIIVDGDALPRDLREQPHVIAECMPRADDTCMAVAAASILAKVARDRYITELGRLPAYANYQLHRHSGYGTALHRQCLEEHGMTDQHRQSFRPMKDMLPLLATSTPTAAAAAASTGAVTVDACVSAAAASSVLP